MNCVKPNYNELWSRINWKKLQKNLFRLQRRVYKAVREGNIGKARSLQKLILRSAGARLLAIRQVTQLNQGKKTAGVDGKKKLTFKERFELYVNLKLNWQNWRHNKLREIPIPKKDGTTRMLKVPTMADRAWQKLVLLAIEPAHEATFHARSYGFRPGRSTHDAQKVIFNNLNSKNNGKNKYVLELDIEKCFDRIGHTHMMELVIAPQCAKIGLWRCLKAGVNPEFPEQGTPQGGIVSPLLANIALNGIESIGESRKPSGKTKIDHIETIRYADDVVAICKSRSQAEELFEKIRAWLAPIGLKVKESKTRIVAATEGFDFLGWHFVVQSNGKFRSTPSEANYQAFKEKVKEIVNSSNLKTEEKSKKLAPIVRGWRNYHRHCKMKGSRFSLWYLQYDAWKRFNKDKNTNRDLTTKLIARAFPTVGYAENKFVNVKEDKSPFDGDMIYWSARQSLRYDGLTVELLKKQKHKCAECGLGFWTGDKVEVHHKDGNHGNWKRSNLVAIHNHCHHYIHMKGVGKDSKS